MKRALKIVAIVVAVLIVIVLVLPFWSRQRYRRRIESELTNALGRNVTVGNVSLSLWSGSLAGTTLPSRTIRRSRTVAAFIQARTGCGSRVGAAHSFEDDPYYGPDPY